MEDKREKDDKLPPDPRLTFPIAVQLALLVFVLGYIAYEVTKEAHLSGWTTALASVGFVFLLVALGNLKRR